MNCKSVLSDAAAAMISACTLFTSAASAGYAENEERIFYVNRENSWITGTTDEGFTYDVWAEGKKDLSGSAAIRNDGSISVAWNTEEAAGSFIFQYGLKYEYGTDPLEQGEISIDYDADYSSGESGNSQMGVHGWLGPQTEFYIIDDWVNWRPEKSDCKTVEIDGGEYELLLFNDTGGDLLPSPDMEHKRYYSIRKQPRASGTITVSEHFRAWAALGWKTEDLRNVSFYVEGWKSEGSAEIKNLRVTAPEAVMPADEQPHRIAGDFNSDGAINSIDLTFAKAALIEGVEFDSASEYMDLNCDHKFNAADIVLLHSFILGKTGSFDKAADKNVK